MRSIIITESQFNYLKEQLLNETKNLVDNFDLIAKLINLTDPDKFFFVQIIKRWKDNKDKGMIKKTDGTYHAGGEMGNFANGTAFKVHNAQELMSLKQQIINYCDANNARAYIVSNPRSESEINSFLPHHLARAAKRNGGIVPDYEKKYGFEHLAGQCKSGPNFPDRIRFFFDIDATENQFYVPRGTRLNSPIKTKSEHGDLYAFATTPQEAQYLKNRGCLNIWEETKNILSQNGVQIETEYQTPSKGLHVVIADKTQIPNLYGVIQQLRVFDGGKDLDKIQTVHANFDGKLILYANVDTAGY